MPPPHFPNFTELAMPALTALAIAAAVRVRRGLKRLIERARSRQDVMRLAGLDDRMLADIGLCRSDLRDAFSERPWRDPSDILARRAAERRVSRRRAELVCVRNVRPPTPLFAAPPVRCYPPADGGARFTA
jgi:uncharacterized protein YjiS (DUF1127 family)